MGITLAGATAGSGTSGRVAFWRDQSDIVGRATPAGLWLAGPTGDGATLFGSPKLDASSDDLVFVYDLNTLPPVPELVSDSSDLTVTSGATPTKRPGVPSDSLEFSGISSGSSTLQSASGFASLPSDGKGLTVSVWMNPSRSVGGVASTKNTELFRLFDGPDFFNADVSANVLRVSVNFNSTEMARFSLSNRSLLQPNRWVHYVFTRAATGEWRAYLNGVRMTLSGPPGVDGNTSTTQDLSGHRLELSPLDTVEGGIQRRISQVACWSTALTQDQVTELYNLGHGRSISSTNVVGFRPISNGDVPSSMSLKSFSDVSGSDPSNDDVLVYDGDLWTPSDPLSTLSSGASGQSGYSGASGRSGWSGQSGASGYTGYSGFSGLDSWTGQSGFSGLFSGESGFSAFVGLSGVSGASGASGFSGASPDILVLDEQASTPSAPTQGNQVKMYVRNDKLVFQFNDGGTVKYHTIDMDSAAGSQLVSTTTTAP